MPKSAQGLIIIAGALIPEIALLHGKSTRGENLAFHASPLAADVFVGSNEFLRFVDCPDNVPIR
jgi:hypothetical protein